MLSILANAKVNIISSGEPAPCCPISLGRFVDHRPHRPSFKSQVAGLLDGSLSGGQSLVVPIQFTQVNPLIFTPGKQKMAEQVLSDLQAGFIDTSVDLTTGEKTP